MNPITWMRVFLVAQTCLTDPLEMILVRSNQWKVAMNVQKLRFLMEEQSPQQAHEKPRVTPLPDVLRGTENHLKDCSTVS